MAADFTIFPAIDLRHGRVVRLQHGDPERETVFGHDPAAQGAAWVAAGAAWLHVVNLDGAFNQQGAANWRALPALAGLGARVQFGGGVRTLADVARALDAGAARVVLGTAAIEEPALVGAAVARFGPERVAVGIDARDGRVRTRGWQQDTTVTPAALGQQMTALGVNTFIYTDISRDGVLTGVNIAATAGLAGALGRQVVASGGVATLADVRRCAALAHRGVAGVIIGRALYDGRVSLADALAVAARPADANREA